MCNTLLSDNALKGAIAQSKAELRALEKGYLVSKPIIEGLRYDMIIDDGTSLKRIQVKYAGHQPQRSKSCVLVDFRKIYKNGKIKSGYCDSEIDAILVYIPPIDSFCYFPIDFVANKGSLTIRFEPSKNNQFKNIIYAKDFLW